MTNDPQDTTTGPDDFADIFDDWIAGATLAQKSVEIYGNPGLYAEYEQLERELKTAQAVHSDTEASMDDTTVADIEDRMRSLYDQWMKSKSVWTVRGITKPDVKELTTLHPEVPMPGDLPADADLTARNEHQAAMDRFEAAADARNYAILERTIMRVEFGDGRTLSAQLGDDGTTVVKPAITATQLGKLRSRLGEGQFIKLIAAGKLALMQEPVIPAPFLRDSSRNEQT